MFKAGPSDEQDVQETKRLRKIWSKSYFKNEPFVVREEDGDPVLSSDKDVSKYMV